MSVDPIVLTADEARDVDALLTWVLASRHAGIPWVGTLPALWRRLRDAHREQQS